MHAFPFIAIRDHPFSTMTTLTSATAELRHLLTIPPASLPRELHPNRMAVAHAVFEHIRDTGDEQFLFLRCLLENTSSSSTSSSFEEEELMFHCITGVRQVSIFRWSEYSTAFLRALRVYFMLLGHARFASSRTCRVSSYITSTALWKRGWDTHGEVENNNKNVVSHKEQSLMESMLVWSNQQNIPFVQLHTPKDLFDYLETLFRLSPLEAAMFLDCLVCEFGSKSSVSYRLPLEFHKHAHRHFEKQGGLLQSLRYALLSLSQWSSSESTLSSSSPAAAAALYAVVQLTADILGWEFGLAAWDAGALGAASATAARSGALIRPPIEWKEYLVGHSSTSTDWCQILLAAHDHYRHEHTTELAHNIRQLIIQFASLSGCIFANKDEQKHYASKLCDGTWKLLELCTNPVQPESSELSDVLQLVSRIISNFRLSTLAESSSFPLLLQRLTSIANALLVDHVQECEMARGDVDAMEHHDWREEVLSLILECAVWLCEDPWLLYSGTEESRRNAQRSMSTCIGPLFESFVRCRTRMAALEEHHRMTRDDEDDIIDEIQEEIMETNMEEEICAISAVGRLHLSAALSSLTLLLSSTVPQLQSIWKNNANRGESITPDVSALLEQSRLLTIFVGHLLTDNNEGESPCIPEAVLLACKENENVADEISSTVQALLQFADFQAKKIVMDPSNVRLSPLLAKSFLWFLIRWAPTYLYPRDVVGDSNASNRLVLQWSNTESVGSVVSFCINLCLTYQCFWPQERAVQEHAAKLLLALAKRGGIIRSVMVSSPSFHELVRFHVLTAGIRQSIATEEFNANIQSKSGTTLSENSAKMLRGYKRLPYEDKARILSFILVTCSDKDNEVSNSLLMDALKSVQDALSSLTSALVNRHIQAEDIHAREMACLCVEMFDGIAHASEMSYPERICQFITVHLSQLSGLMVYYSSDLSVCESLLRFFRDYAAEFTVYLDRNQSLVLFNACSELLKSYSANHCSTREIKKLSLQSSAEAKAAEEQAYNDILCVIQLLINLGAKDYIDACSSAQEGLESSQVTDVIFFGLQQILPLMTQGLLQYPTLCAYFFDLVGFMIDTYPERTCTLPRDLFQTFLESILFGMSHHDCNVAKSSLHGLASLAREHLDSGSLRQHLEHTPDMMDRCSRRLLAEVVFQTVIVDRVEAAGMALLPIIAINPARFVAVAHELTNQVPDQRQRDRLGVAFSKLIQPEMIAKANSGGYEGRANRIRFKEKFEEFVNEVHAFLITR
jgi:hypothetical protein